LNKVGTSLSNVLFIMACPVLTPYLDPTILQLQSNTFDHVDQHVIRLVTHDQYRRLSTPQSLFFMWKLLFLFHSILNKDDAPFRLTEYSDHVSFAYKTSNFAQVITFFDQCNVSLKPRNSDSPVSQQRSDKRFSIHIFYLFKYLGFNTKETTKAWVVLTIPSLTDVYSLLQSASFSLFNEFFSLHPNILFAPLSSNFPLLILNVDPFTHDPNSSSPPLSSQNISPLFDAALESSLASDLSSLQETVDLFIDQHPLYVKLMEHSMVFRCLPPTSRRFFLTELISLDLSVA